jgi:hypothetical protein
MKQTAVEWLSRQISEIIDITPLSQKQEEKLINTINKALEMEEQQIIDAFIGYDSDTKDNLEVAEQYYNETFKQQEQ